MHQFNFLNTFQRRNHYPLQTSKVKSFTTIIKSQDRELPIVAKFSILDVYRVLGCAVALRKSEKNFLFG